MELRHVREHYEVYENGQFVVSGDTAAEALKEYEAIKAEESAES